MRRKKKAGNAPVFSESDLPQNSEFQEFVQNVRQIMSVPKTEIDRLLAEERELKAKIATEVEEIEERLAGSPACEPEQ